jgi:hypothetical protein
VAFCESECSRLAPRDEIPERPEVFRLTSRGEAVKEWDRHLAGNDISRVLWGASSEPVPFFQQQQPRSVMATVPFILA